MGLKRFIVKTLLFALLAGSLLMAGEWMVRRQPTSYTSKARFLLHNGESVATLILGPSHAYYGLKPQLLGDSVFNLANVSQTPDYDRELLERYIDSMPNLRLLILNITPFTFREPSLDDGPGRNLAVNYKVGMDINRHSDLSTYNFFLSDFPTYRKKMKGILGMASGNRCDSLGFGLGYDLEARDPHWKGKAERRAQDFNVPSSAEVRSQMAGEYDRMLRLCRERGIKTAFVITPIHPVLRRLFRTDLLPEMRAVTDSLARTDQAPVFDFMEDPRFDDSAFFDLDHLSSRGADTLSRILTPLLPK